MNLARRRGSDQGSDHPSRRGAGVTAQLSILLPQSHLHPPGMTREESRAVAFVGVLLVLATVARLASRPKPLLITAGPVDLAALRAAGQALALAPAPGRKGRQRSPVVRATEPPAPAPAPQVWTTPAWQRSRQPPSFADRTESPTEKPTAPLDLNHADAKAIERLPGIGPAVAQRIVARRDSIRRFQKIEDLDPIKGIGPALIEKLRPLVILR